MPDPEFRQPFPPDWQNLPDAELVRAAVAEIWESRALQDEPDKFRWQIDSLAPGQSAVAITRWVHEGIHGEGFRVYLKETLGVTRAEMQQAFRTLGMDAAAEVLAGVDTMTASESQFAKLYARWFEARKALLERQAAYIRAHPDEFFR